MHYQQRASQPAKTFVQVMTARIIDEVAANLAGAPGQLDFCAALRVDARQVVITELLQHMRRGRRRAERAGELQAAPVGNWMPGMARLPFLTQVFNAAPLPATPGSGRRS